MSTAPTDDEPYESTQQVRHDDPSGDETEQPSTQRAAPSPPPVITISRKTAGGKWSEPIEWAVSTSGLLIGTRMQAELSAVGVITIQGESPARLVIGSKSPESGGLGMRYVSSKHLLLSWDGHAATLTPSDSAGIATLGAGCVPVVGTVPIVKGMLLTLGVENATAHAVALRFGGNAASEAGDASSQPAHPELSLEYRPATMDTADGAPWTGQHAWRKDGTTMPRLVVGASPTTPTDSHQYEIVDVGPNVTSDMSPLILSAFVDRQGIAVTARKGDGHTPLYWYDAGGPEREYRELSAGSRLKIQQGTVIVLSPPNSEHVEVRVSGLAAGAAKPHVPVLSLDEMNAMVKRRRMASAGGPNIVGSAPGRRAGVDTAVPEEASAAAAAAATATATAAAAAATAAAAAAAAAGTANQQAAGDRRDRRLVDELRGTAEQLTLIMANPPSTTDVAAVRAYDIAKNKLFGGVVRLVKDRQSLTHHKKAKDGVKAKVRQKQKETALGSTRHSNSASKVKQGAGASKARDDRLKPPAVCKQWRDKGWCSFGPRCRNQHLGSSGQPTKWGPTHSAKRHHDSRGGGGGRAGKRGGSGSRNSSHRGSG